MTGVSGQPPTPLLLGAASGHRARPVVPSGVVLLEGGPVRALAGALRHARRVGLSGGDLVRAVLDPDDEWLSPVDGVAIVRVRDGAAVIVAGDDYTLILSAMAARRAYQERRRAGGRDGFGGRRRPRSGGGAGRRPQSVAALLGLCAEHGFEHRLSKSGHHRLTHPGVPGRAVSLPSTPSDSRSIPNAVATIRTVFGIDVRRAPTDH